MIDVISEIDHLIEKTPFLIDIFPEQIPPKADNRYFEIEDLIFEDGKQLVDMVYLKRER